MKVKKKTRTFSNSCLLSQSGESVWFVNSSATSHMTTNGHDHNLLWDKANQIGNNQSICRFWMRGSIIIISLLSGNYSWTIWFLKKGTITGVVESDSCRDQNWNRYCYEFTYYWIDVRNRNCISFGCHGNLFYRFCYQKRHKRIAADRFEIKLKIFIHRIVTI